MKIAELNLSETDFDAIIEGLDSLQSRHVTGEIMTSMLEDIFLKDSNSPIKQERARKKAEEEAKRRLENERIKILQGKLLKIRQDLRSIGALTAE